MTQKLRRKAQSRKILYNISLCDDKGVVRLAHDGFSGKERHLFVEHDVFDKAVFLNYTVLHYNRIFYCSALSDMDTAEDDRVFY